jgi:peptidoglycan/LPS O-acetylase OafA/YrhL
LNIETIFLFSIIHGITTIIISLLSYLFFELPYKKLIKNYVKEDESKKLDFSGSFDNENDDDYYESEDDN